MTVGFLMAAAGAVLADASLPILRAQVEQPFVSEASNEFAVLIVRCNAPLKAPLRVRYRLSGTARSGADFEGLSGVLRIARGASEARMVIQPVDDAIREGTERIVISLVNSPHYRVRGSQRHTISIEDDESPGISISTWIDPRYNRYYNGPAYAPSIVLMMAGMTVPAGAGYTIESIEIFVGDSSVGTRSGAGLILGADSFGTRYQTGVAREFYPGRRVITATATTSDGMVIVSRPYTALIPLRPGY